MKRIEACSTLEYAVVAPAEFLFQIAVAENEHQKLIEESLAIDPPRNIERCRVGASGNRLMRLSADAGPLIVRYRALVELNQELADPAALGECSYSDLPVEVLGYLNPSRYCESDLLQDFAWNRFGQLTQGHGRVSEIVNWVHEHLDYVPGSTNSTTTARDVLIQCKGVCRDYAHLVIALCRALGIPARYVAGYAVGLDPPDFHGFCEVWLGEGWYLFDATHLAPVGGFVRIGTGRDAADVSFATIIGSASSTIAPKVMAVQWADYAQNSETAEAEENGKAVSID